MNMDWIYYSYAEPPNSAVLHTLPFGSPNRCISDFANASSKFLASLGTSDIPKTLGDISLGDCHRKRLFKEGILL